MLTQLRPALALFILLTLVTGVAYPAAVTAIANLAFSDKAQGSILFSSDGTPIGSALIGQDFSSGNPQDAAKWFWGRPSATGPVPYTSLNLTKGTGSSGSNLAPSNPALLDNVNARITALAAADQAVNLVRAAHDPIPVDLVTASGSGLDPHISLASAQYQAPRIAKARSMSLEAVNALISKHTVGRTFGVLGEPIVNVLKLNMDLTQQSK